MIFNGQLTAGQRIPQDEIAAELGVSRLPVREAISTLQLDGLVVVEKYRGAFVLPISHMDIEDHYEVFGHTHGIAAARAAKKITASDLDELRGLNEQLSMADDLTLQHKLNWEFHRNINVIGGSRRLQSVIGGLARQIPRSFTASFPPASPRALIEHKTILGALEAGDGEAAAVACIAHLRSEAKYIIDMLEGRGLLGAPEPEPETVLP